jgi:pyridoxal phosphate enzyme (YggS family)
MKRIYQKIESELALQKATLIAVSKKQPAYKIKQALSLGIKNFGESYMQEALTKINDGVFKDATLHFIGHLQTNKTKEAVLHFEYIHSVDRLKLINSIEKEAFKQSKVQKIFIHVKPYSDENKSGCSIEELPALLEYTKTNCPHIQVCGLMCIPPLNIQAKKAFQAIETLTNEYKFKETSMGMSSDYPEALKHGATFIRVGTALFGERS